MFYLVILIDSHLFVEEKYHYRLITKFLVNRLHEIIHHFLLDILFKVYFDLFLHLDFGYSSCKWRNFEISLLAS